LNPSFAARIFEYKKSSKLEDEGDVNYHVADSRVLVLYDRLMYRVSRICDYIGLRHIFGKNIPAVAKLKKNMLLQEKNYSAKITI
jgi:hypothetical protein|tara:strand:- start:577 stop:831 length:255 start_codon:yes stop_codon:yes gene_type:complete